MIVSITFVLAVGCEKLNYLDLITAHISSPSILEPECTSWTICKGEETNLHNISGITCIEHLEKEQADKLFALLLEHGVNHVDMSCEGMQKEPKHIDIP